MEVDKSSQPGTPVLCPPYTHRPDAQLNPKKKVTASMIWYYFQCFVYSCYEFQIWETVSVDLKVSPEGYAVWKDCPLLVGGNTKMTAPSLRDVFIK